MTGTARIRWHETPGADPAWTGSVGTVNPSLFQIYAPDGFAPQWILTTSFPGMEDKRSYDDHPDELKAEAERWLEEFVSSLGAVFPDRLRADIARERDMYCGIAAQREREGRELQAERLHKYVDGLDRALALMDRMTPETTTPAAGEASQ